MAKTAKTAKAANSPEDVVLVHGKTDDGAYQVLRKKDDTLFIGEMRATAPGKPIAPGGELVSLAPRGDTPNLFDVESIWKAPAEGDSAESASADATTSQEPTLRTAADGPAQVTTEAYRDGFRAIWGSPTARKKRELN